MSTKITITKEMIESNGALLKAATKTEERMHLLERPIKDILDEIGDCIHDDISFRKRMLNEIFLRPDMKRKIAFKFISLIIQR